MAEVFGWMFLAQDVLKIEHFGQYVAQNVKVNKYNILYLLTQNVPL